MTMTIDKGTTVSCQKPGDKNQWGISLLSGDTRTHTNSVQACVYSYLALLLPLSLLIIHMRNDTLINERRATMTCYVNGSANVRASCI